MRTSFRTGQQPFCGGCPAFSQCACILPSSVPGFMEEIQRGGLLRRTELCDLLKKSGKSRFTEKGEGVENQVEVCRQFLSMFHDQQAADRALVYEEEGFSGGSLDRPQFWQMMHVSRQRRFAAIVVYRLD